MSSEKSLRSRAGIDDTSLWPAFAWPGGYPIVYVAGDGEIFCATCMNTEAQIYFDGLPGDDPAWRVDGLDIHYEGDPAICCNCNAEIPSAYGPVEGESVGQ